jgi:protein TonB
MVGGQVSGFRFQISAGTIASTALHAAILLAVLKAVFPAATPTELPSPLPMMVQMVSSAALPQKEVVSRQSPVASKKVVREKVATKKALTPKPVKPTSSTTQNTKHTPLSTQHATLTSPSLLAPSPSPTTAPQFDAAYLHNPAPDYPAAAKRRRMQGLVMLSVAVTAEGRAESVTLKQSSGFAPLDNAAIAAVKQWRFVPAKQADTPVAASVIVPVEFALR